MDYPREGSLSVDSNQEGEDSGAIERLVSYDEIVALGKYRVVSEGEINDECSMSGAVISWKSG